MLYDPLRSRPVDDEMALQADGGDWVQWLTLGFSAVIAFLSGTGSAGYFAGQARQEIKTLKERVNQGILDRDALRIDLRTAVSDLRTEIQKVSGSAAKVSDTQRIEAHLLWQDEKIDNRFNQVVGLILNGRSNGTT